MKDLSKIKKNSEKILSVLADLTEAELAALVLKHNQKYFEENSPEISDEAFDKLVESLRFINPRSEALSDIGHRVETNVSSQFGATVQHSEPMLSLEKCYSDDDFFKWAAKINGDFVVMPKIDGVAASLIYNQRGELVCAKTRGDGMVGDDITKNVLLIPKLPVQIAVEDLHFDEDIDIRGEIYIPISQFNQHFAADFVNPRNLAAGVIKLKESDPAKNSFLQFFPYDIRGTSAKTEVEKFSLLERLGFSMMPWSIVTNDSSATNIYIDIFEKRSTFDYEVDGVVFRANELSEQRRLGETAHHPRYALAYKFQGESASTLLENVEWSVARSGAITPIAIVKPVFVSGASITRASLHNLGIFRALDLRHDSLVEINRRGGVIPHLERVLSRKGDAILEPTQCPSCGGPVIVDGDFLRCKQPQSCDVVVISQLLHFCHVVGIEGLGEKIVAKLFAAGLLRNFVDIFRLTEERLLSIERFGDILAHKIIREINAARKIPLATFIRALGIDEIGGTVASLLAVTFHNLSTMRHVAYEDLLPIHGIGDNIARSFVDGIALYSDQIDALLEEIVVIDEDMSVSNVDENHPLFGKSIVFTGKMAHLDRKSAQSAVKKIGGRPLNAMSGAVHYLVIGDDGSPLLGTGKKSTKHKEAEKLQSEGAAIAIISETEFLKLLH